MANPATDTGVLNALMRELRSATAARPIEKRKTAEKLHRLRRFADHTVTQIERNFRWLVWAPASEAASARKFDKYWVGLDLVTRPTRPRQYYVAKRHPPGAERRNAELLTEVFAREGGVRDVTLELRARSTGLASMCKKRDGFRCRVCDLKMSEFYGTPGNDYAEAHHLDQLARKRGERVVSLSRLITVCSNCHRMLHRTNDPADWKSLKQSIANNGLYGAMRWQSR